MCVCIYVYMYTNIYYPFCMMDAILSSEINSSTHYYAKKEREKFRVRFLLLPDE